MKKNRIIIAYFLALVFLANIFGTISKVDASGHDLEIRLKGDKDLLEIASKSQVDFSYWKLGDEISLDIQTDKTQLVSELHKLSEEELDDLYQSGTIQASFSDMSLFLDGLDQGIYYFRNQMLSQSYKYTSEFIVKFEGEPIILIDKITKTPLKSGSVILEKVDDNGNKLEGVGFELYTDKGEKVPLIGEYVYSLEGSRDQVLYSNKDGLVKVSELPYGKYYFKEVEGLEGYKMDQREQEFSIEEGQEEVKLTFVNEKVKFGGYKFLKIASDAKKTPLKGAKFKVTRFIEGSFETVMQDGKELILKSDREGKFEVKNLPYGIYTLWELEAPRGYSKLTDGVEFEVDETSHTKVLFIKNSKKPKIPVPKTGDLLIPLGLVVSVAMFGSGYGLSKNKKKKN